MERPEEEEDWTGLYDWHTATCAEVPHVAVFRHEGGLDETRIADFYIIDGDWQTAENLAIELVDLLNERAKSSKD